MALNSAELKAKGNAAFQERDYAEACRWFSEGITVDGGNHVLFSNRSAAYAGLKKWEKALEDAETCISLKPDWGKGYMRRGSALHELGHLQEARETYRKGLAVEPGSEILQRAMADQDKACEASYHRSVRTKPRCVPGELTICNQDGSIAMVMPPVDPSAQPEDPDFLIEAPPIPVDVVLVDARWLADTPEEKAAVHPTVDATYGEDDDHEAFTRMPPREATLRGERSPSRFTSHTASNGVELHIPTSAKPLLFKDVPAARMRALSFQDKFPPARLRLTVFELPPVGRLKGLVLAGCRPGADMLFAEPGDDGPASAALGRRTKLERESFALEAFIAGAELGDLNSLFLVREEAKEVAFKKGRLREFAASMDKYLRLLSAVDHVTVPQQVVLYAIEAGEVHEAAFQQTDQSADYKNAVLSYKFGCDAATRRVEVMSPITTLHAWNCLGLALKRAGEYGMAYRAYRWAYQCLTHPDFSLLRGKSLHDGLMTNLGALNYAMSNPTEAAFSNREGLRQQNEEHRNFIRNKSGAKPPVAPSSEACAGCGASGGHNLLNCACKRVKYCGKACQEAAWAAHKKDCKRWRKHP